MSAVGMGKVRVWSDIHVRIGEGPVLCALYEDDQTPQQNKTQDCCSPAWFYFNYSFVVSRQVSYSNCYCQCYTFITHVGPDQRTLGL